MSTKRYPEELKIEAIKQVTERGHAVADVASRLGVSTRSMYSGTERLISRPRWPQPAFRG